MYTLPVPPDKNCRFQYMLYQYLLLEMVGSNFNTSLNIVYEVLCIKMHNFIVILLKIESVDRDKPQIPTKIALVFINETGLK